MTSYGVVDRYQFFQRTCCPYLHNIVLSPEDGGRRFTETLVRIYKITRLHIPEGRDLNFHRHENIDSINYSRAISSGNPLHLDTADFPRRLHWITNAISIYYFLSEAFLLCYSSRDLISHPYEQALLSRFYQSQI